MANVSNINGYDIKDKNARDSINDINANLSNVQTVTNRLINKKIVLIGDSYLEGYNPDGNVTSWGSLFKNYLGLNDDQVIISYLGGSSFSGSNPFTDLVNALSSDDDVTDIIVGGGYNDKSFNRTQILTGMTSFKNACITKFPNAKIYLAMIGWSADPSNIYNLYNTCINYKINASKLGIAFLNGTEYSLHDYFTMFASDLIHPTNQGQEAIAQAIVNAFLNGSSHTYLTYKTIGQTASGSCTEITQSFNNLSAELHNNMLQISSQGVVEYTINNISYTANGKNDIEVADINSGYIIGSSYRMTNIPVQLIVHADGSYHKVNGNIIFRNKKVYLSFAEVNSSGNNYLLLTSIDQIQVCPFSGSFDSLFC